MVNQVQLANKIIKANVHEGDYANHCWHYIIDRIQSTWLDSNSFWPNDPPCVAHEGLWGDFNLCYLEKDVSWSASLDLSFPNFPFNPLQSWPTEMFALMSTRMIQKLSIEDCPNQVGNTKMSEGNKLVGAEFVDSFRFITHYLFNHK